MVDYTKIVRCDVCKKTVDPEGAALEVYVTPIVEVADIDDLDLESIDVCLECCGETLRSFIAARMAAQRLNNGKEHNIPM